MARAISSFMTDTGCIDPWRFLYPQSKEFSFFSQVHRSFSRIDCFFIDKALIPLVKKIEYSAIVESDHGPVLLDIIFAHHQSEHPSWRLNTSLLADEGFCKHISTALDNFILTNKSDSVSPSLLW